MKYISIDIETTGLDPKTCQILSIGAVIEDTNTLIPFDELPKFHGVIKREHVSGSIFALNLNKDLIEEIKNNSVAKTDELKKHHEVRFGCKFYDEDKIVEALFQFCYMNGLVPHNEKMLIGTRVTDSEGNSFPMLTSNLPKTYITCAGKNFAGFDQKFLELLPRWKQVFSIRSRVLDPGILFVDWKNDEAVPSLFECKQRAGIDGIVTHNAVEDAMDVVMLLRTKY
jgi:DNA polymerase III epsilon subunit-like protein